MMEELELKQRAQQLREDLRIERNEHSTDKGNRGTVQGSRGTNDTLRPNSQDIRGYTEISSGDTEDARSVDRGSEISTKRGRSNSGRFEHDSGLTSNRSSETRRTGLTRGDDPLIEGSKTGQKASYQGQIKDTARSIKDAIFAKKGSVLTKKEADEYYEPLKTAIQDNGTSLDQLIEWRIGRPLGREIWGNITDFEAECLAKVMLKRGMSNPYAAATVRKFIESQDYITVGVMMLPRVQMTVETIRLAEREKREIKY